MIINNYNGSLPENTETIMTATKCPMINIRAFEASIKAGSSLIIPYYVSDFDQVEYRQEKLGPTFTTIFTLDEDTVPANQVRTWKQTTYAGEQVIDLGVFDEVGIHTLNVRTIMSVGESDGVASATKLLKFIVHPAGTKTVLDLSTLSGFSGEFTNYQKYRMMYLQEWNGIGPCLSVYNCDYAVTKTVETMDGEDKVTDIQIVVTKPTGFTGHCITNHKIDDDGNINVKNGTSIDNYLDIDQWETDGVYHIATKCIVDGATVELKDYLGVPLSQLPAAVIETAAKNKVALTRLFEAAKAWRWKQVFDDLVHELDRPTEEGLAACAVAASDAVKYEFTFKMPQMDIVCDYHYAYAPSLKDPRCTVSLSDMNSLWIHREGTNTDGSGTYSANLREFYGRDDIWIPDGMTVDMNGTNISMLQITNVHGGMLLHMLYNINTHLINGNLVGIYKGVEFAHFDDMESLHTTAMHGCQFCSYENLDVSWSTGYDLSTGNASGRGEDVSLNSGSLLLTFNERGYIDYTGEKKTIAGNGLGWYMTPSGGDDGDFVRIHQYGWTVSGRIFRVTRYYPLGAPTVHTKTCREMFVHFYKKLGPNNYQFIKTVKVMQRFPVLLPYGATHVKMSMYGSTSSSSGADYLYPNNKELSFARDFITFSWCSGCKNIKYHNTRSCALDNGGVQTFIRSVKFLNASLERYGPGLKNPNEYYHFTKMLIDIEDDGYELFNLWMENVEMVFGDSRHITAGRGYDGHFKNCRNIDIGSGVDAMDVLIENCSLSITFHHNENGLGSGSHFIVRNSLIEAFTNEQGSNAELGGQMWIHNNSLLSHQKPDDGPLDESQDYGVEVIDDIKL